MQNTTETSNGCISLLFGLALWIGGSAVVGLTTCGVIVFLGHFALKLIGVE